MKKLIKKIFGDYQLDSQTQKILERANRVEALIEGVKNGK